MALDERSAYLTLALVPGIGPARLATLLDHFGSALGALSAPFAFLCDLPGISRAAATAITTADRNAARRALEATAARGARLLFPADPEFPATLRLIPDPPALLFAEGRLELLQRPAVAVVGSRDHSAYGASICRRVSGASARAGLAVVSGMARGLDALAHAAALEAGGATIGVLGNGLGVVYPAANRSLYRKVSEGGLLLTEFPPGERPVVGSFPRRNRLISGLARVTVVIEAAEGSGTLITVGTALAQGRDVMAVPGNITSRTSVGTNRLLRDGAEPLLGVEDLLAHYPEAEAGHRRPIGTPSPALPSAPADLTPAEARLHQALGAGALATDDLIRVAGVSPAETLAALSALELRGLVAQRGGVVELRGT